ncbi:MAG: fumarylacetoacetate hydrolase family protein [Chthoniobacter sp.]
MPLPPVTLYRSSEDLLAQRGEDCFRLPEQELDTLFTEADPARWLHEQISRAEQVVRPAELLAPIGNQEVWAAGVTYLRSRDARIDESKDAGGGTFYDRVYDAPRPEIFFKATPQRVVGPGAKVRIRSDSHWNVPEPEVTLAINEAGHIFGYTIGNDMSSRDIEGENPLYLPQAKVYAACCALGPGLVVRDALPRETGIEIEIARDGARHFPRLDLAHPDEAQFRGTRRLPLPRQHLPPWLLPPHRHRHHSSRRIHPPLRRRHPHHRHRSRHLGKYRCIIKLCHPERSRRTPSLYPRCRWLYYGVLSTSLRMDTETRVALVSQSLR